MHILREFFSWAPLGLPAFLFYITVVVFVHEMGHFLMARFFKAKVDVFSIGFGPEIFGWNDKRGTRWRLSWLPIGGCWRWCCSPACSWRWATPCARP
jgi:regulator of sigma E protease